MTANGDGGAGFVIVVQGAVRVAEAGHGVSELRAEAIACLAGLRAILDLQDYSTCQGIRVLTDSQSLIRCLSQGPAHQSDSTCCSIWTSLSAISTLQAVDVQWIPAHVGLEGNAAAEQQAERRSTLTQSTVTMNYTTTACATPTSDRNAARKWIGLYSTAPGTRMGQIQ